MDLQTEIEGARRSGSFHRARRRSPEGAFAAPIVDNANFPEFRVEDVVVVDPKAAPKPGDFVYIEVRKGDHVKRTVRQYAEPADDQVTFIPVNRRHTTYKAGAGVKLLGKVVELSRGFGAARPEPDLPIAA